MLVARELERGSQVDAGGDGVRVGAERVARGALGGGHVASGERVVAYRDRIVLVTRKVDIGHGISPWGEGEDRPKGNMPGGNDSGASGRG